MTVGFTMTMIHTPHHHDRDEGKRKRERERERAPQAGTATVNHPAPVGRELPIRLMGQNAGGGLWLRIEIGLLSSRHVA